MIQSARLVARGLQPVSFVCNHPHRNLNKNRRGKSLKAVSRVCRCFFFLLRLKLFKNDFFFCHHTRTVRQRRRLNERRTPINSYLTNNIERLRSGALSGRLAPPVKARCVPKCAQLLSSSKSISPPLQTFRCAGSFRKKKQQGIPFRNAALY